MAQDSISKRAPNTAFPLQKSQQTASFLALSTEVDEILASFAVEVQSPVNVAPCTRYTLTIFTVLSQT